MIIVSNSLFFLNDSSCPLFSILLINQVNIRVVSIIMFEILSQFSHLRSQIVIILNSSILKSLFLLLSHQLIKLVLLFLGGFTDVLAAVAKVPGLYLVLLLYKNLLPQIILVLDLTPEKCASLFLGVKIYPLGIIFIFFK